MNRVSPCLILLSFLASLVLGFLVGRYSEAGRAAEAEPESWAHILGERAEHVVIQNPVMTQLRGIELIEGCEFQSQVQHFIDMELLFQLGGAVELQLHNPNRGGQATQARAKCSPESLPGQNAIQRTCKCAVPTAFKFDPLSAPPPLSGVGSGGERPRYVEIGADDGKFLSNTYFFDRQLGWEGICVRRLLWPM